MKPTIYLIVEIAVEDTETKKKKSVSAAFKSKLPTNVIPRKGDFLGIYIWEDPADKCCQRDDVEVTEVYHNLVNKKWEQFIYVHANLQSGYDVPTRMTMEASLQDELDWAKTFLVPNLEKQGFETVVAPNTEDRTGPLGDE